MAARVIGLGAVLPELDGHCAEVGVGRDWGLRCCGGGGGLTKMRVEGAGGKDGEQG